MIKVRKMQAADAKQAAALESRVFSMPWSEQDFMEMIEADYAHYCVAEENGRIVGCCGFRDIAGEGEITNVVVDADFRKKGIARQMLEYTLSEAVGRGIKACTLEVRISNTAAIRLYEGLGFLGEGVRPRFYEKPTEDALIMWKR